MTRSLPVTILACMVLSACSINTRVGPAMAEPPMVKKLQDPIPDLSATKVFIITDRNVLGSYTIEINFNADQFVVHDVRMGDINSFSGEPKVLRKHFDAGKIRISSYVSELDRYDTPEQTKYHVANIYWKKSTIQAVTMNVTGEIIKLYDPKGRNIDGKLFLAPDTITAPATQAE